MKLMYVHKVVCEVVFTDLLWTKVMRRMHEMRTDHRVGYTKAMLCWELHTLLELLLENTRVEAEKYILLFICFAVFLGILFSCYFS